MEKAIIYENDLIRIFERRNVEKCFYTIHNKTNHTICIHYDEPGYIDNYDPLIVSHLIPTLLHESEETGEWIKAIKKGFFHIENLSETERYFNDLLDEIGEQINRIYNQYSIYQKSESENIYNSNQLVTVLEILKSIK